MLGDTCMAKNRIYRRTAEGQKALMESTIGMAGGEYRRILDLVVEDMHYDALRAALPHYSDGVIARWLRELEGRGLLESSAGDSGQDLDFTGSFNFQQDAAKS
jgi:DNA-binding HxlR family transcriptional regulator